MEKDLDMKLYREYLNGKKEALELLYEKYKDRIEYFVFNIIKDKEKAKDITQEVFLEIMQRKIKDGYNFKYHIFLLAKSKSLNDIKLEKRRNEINEKYIYHEDDKIEKDTLEIITKKETKKEIIEAINMLDDKYRNVLYLVKIEELSYREVAEILEETLQNIKNLVHRGKKELRKNLIKKGFNEMNKVSKVLILIICVSALLSGIVYATTQILKVINKNSNVTLNPSYESKLNENTSNNLWVGTFEIAWKELAKKVGNNGKIELVEEIEMVNQLNESTFTKEMLSKDDYSISISKNKDGGYDIFAALDKNLNFIHTFDNFSNDFVTYTFGDGDSEESIKYFGINNASLEKLNENVEVLFYNKSDNLIESNDFAVILKTQEGDEIILYRTDEEKSFIEYYNDINSKRKAYTGQRIFEEKDELLVPYINVNGIISYEELNGKPIKNSQNYINENIQDVNFSLNEHGCNLDSTATMITKVLSGKNRSFEFTDTFILFMKEKDSLGPYFALKVDNTDILEKRGEEQEPQIVDNTVVRPGHHTVEDGEYKFYEDENYEYYYLSKKTKLVKVFYKDGDIRVETVEEALRNNRITIELLDKYGVEYIKKEK